MSYDLEDMLFLLLSIKNTNYSTFVLEHLTISRVGALCSEAVQEGFLVESRKELKLTEKGMDFIKKTNDRLDRHGLARVIAPVPDVYIRKISVDDIYLPSKM